MFDLPTYKLIKSIKPIELFEIITRGACDKSDWVKERIKESKEALDNHKQLIRDIKLNDLGI